MTAPAADAASPRTEGLPRGLLAMLDVMSPRAYGELYRGVALAVHPPPSAGQAWRQEIAPLADMLRPLLPPLEEILGHSDGPRAVRRVDFSLVVRQVGLTRREYDLRRPAGARPSAWLRERYRHWVIALEVAAGLMEDGRYIGRRNPGPNRMRGRARKPRYERHEHPAAIRQCALALGRVPSSNQYILWSRIRRALAAQAGEDAMAACRLPDWTSFRRHYGGWPQALAATILDPAEIAAARSALLATRPIGTFVEDDGALGPRAVLSTLDPADFTELGLTPSQAAKLASNGFAGLEISAAVKVAHWLEGSLSWLAELDDEPGTACDPGLRFSGPRVRDTRARAGVPEAVVRSRLNLTIGQWRGLLRASGDPQLRLVRDIARLLACRIEDLCQTDGGDAEHASA